MINLLYKVVDTYPCVFESVHDGYKTREMSDEVVSNNPFMLKYCLDRYETKKMRDKAVHDCLPTFKFVHGWFVASRMFE